MVKLVIMFVLMVLDTLSGSVVAIRNGSFTSNKFRTGAMSKMTAFIIVAVFFVISEWFSSESTALALLIPSSLTAVTFCAGEVSSIVENVKKLNGKD